MVCSILKKEIEREGESYHHLQLCCCFLNLLIVAAVGIIIVVVVIVGFIDVAVCRVVAMILIKLTLRQQRPEKWIHLRTFAYATTTTTTTMGYIKITQVI